MNIPFRLTLIGGILAALLTSPLPRSFARSQTSSHFTLLSASDRTVALKASWIGAHRSPHEARHWLVSQPSVTGVAPGRDGVTLDVRFQDGAEVTFVPHTVHLNRVQLNGSRFRPLAMQRDTAAGKATVLEPFADELGLGANAGQAEIDSLHAAGFTVDVHRNTDVTLATMLDLANYSVVYMETHSGTLGDGDAIVLTRQTSTAGLGAYFKDGSIAQGLAYGDQALYVAIKSQFILQHMGTFPNGSILFLNGCELLGANVMWDAFRQHNVATMISWDNKVLNTLDEQTADFMFPRLAHGESVAVNIQAAQAAGLGSSTFENTVAHLGYLGNGDVTFSNALQGTLPPTATATVTATPSAATPTSTPTPTPTDEVAAGITFDKISTANNAGHRSQSFRAGESVSVKARYTVRNAATPVAVAIRRTIAYRHGKNWSPLGRSTITHASRSNGTHVYAFSFAVKAHRTQRVAIAITALGHTKTRTVSITVSR